MNTQSSHLITPISEQLARFASLENFWKLFDTAFGSEYNPVIAQTLQSQWENHDFSQLPQIEVVSSEVLGNAKGAYASSTNTIYLSEGFVADASPASLKAVILEEIGHFVDAQVNPIDAQGDEGAIFSALVGGATLTPEQLQQLRAEDDHGIVTLNNQIIQVEQASPYAGNNLIDVINGIDQLLTLIQTGIDLQVYANQLPLLGDKLKDSTNTVVDFVSNFEDNILSELHAKLDSATTKTPALVRDALLQALGTNGLNLLQDLNGDSVINGQDITIVENTDNVDFTLKLKKNQETFSTLLDTDIGLPKLGLTVGGQGQVGLGYDFTLKFGVNKTNGFYFDTSTACDSTLGPMQQPGTRVLTLREKV